MQQKSTSRKRGQRKMRKPAPARDSHLSLERETGFEPATSTLARSHSTTALLPLGSFDYKQAITSQQRRAHFQPQYAQPVVGFCMASWDFAVIWFRTSQSSL